MRRRKSKDIHTSDAGEVGFGLASAFGSPPFTLKTAVQRKSKRERRVCAKSRKFSIFFVCVKFHSHLFLLLLRSRLLCECALRPRPHDPACF